MKDLKGTKTEKNLQEAFAGESQARNKYTYFASKAKKDGYDYISHTTEDPSADYTFPETVALNPSKTLREGAPNPQSTFYDSLDVPKEDLIIRDGKGKAMSVEPNAPTAKTDPQASLKQEAKKYKTAEEFIDATWNRGLPDAKTNEFIDNLPEAKKWANILADKETSETKGSTI